MRIPETGYVLYNSFLSPADIVQESNRVIKYSFSSSFFHLRNIST